MRIAIHVFDGAEELDRAGPWEVLASWAQRFDVDDVQVVTVADHREPITCTKGLRVLADQTWDDVGAIDVLIYPGDLGDDSEVRADDRFVDDGQVITAAGVSAGIDMALHLVARLRSVERAREVRRYIQYDPQPPV